MFSMPDGWRSDCGNHDTGCRGDWQRGHGILEAAYMPLNKLRPNHSLRGFLPPRQDKPLDAYPVRNYYVITP